FESMLYIDVNIITCIPLEALVNQDMWGVKVSLIVYRTVKMHESDQVLQQFGC
ncbi:hypothetical protein J1N35_000940, partial [Gossypium stocksii]